MKIQFKEVAFHGASLKLIERANQVAAIYEKKGIALTLRSLFYQFVRRNWIKNTDKDYKNFGHTLSEARLVGLVDWNTLADQHRPRRLPFHFDNMKQKMDFDLDPASYTLDRWAGQDYHVEVMIEKDAILSLYAPVCEELHVGILVNKGYNSQTVMFELSWRLRQYRDRKGVIILYIGDHDPSGNNMVEDIQKRFAMFGLFDEVNLEIKKIALTMAQIRQYRCPPQPLKRADATYRVKKPGTLVDSRAVDYMAAFGDQSWEVDALDPEDGQAILRKAILGYLDQAKFDAVMAKEALEMKKIAPEIKATPTYRRLFKAERLEEARIKREEKKAKLKAKVKRLEAKGLRLTARQELKIARALKVKS